MSTSILTKDGVYLNNSPLINLPVGVIFVWLATSLPTNNYLWCDGSVYDPVEYVELYDVIGNSYGGTTASPMLPDLLNRAPIGGIVNGNNLDISLGSNEPPGVYNTTSLKTGGNSSLIPSQFIHTHSITGGPFITGVQNTNNTNNNGPNENGYNNNNYNNDFTFGETGTSTPHFPPHLKVNYIIFAGKKTSTPTSNKY